MSQFSIPFQPLRLLSPVAQPWQPNDLLPGSNHLQITLMLLVNKIPDYTFLKTFSYLWYPFLCPYNSKKINFRSLPYIFLGYSMTHKGYLCFHQPSSCVYVSRHVVFNETIFPYLTPISNKLHLLFRLPLMLMVTYFPSCISLIYNTTITASAILNSLRILFHFHIFNYPHTSTSLPSYSLWYSILSNLDGQFSCKAHSTFNLTLSTHSK